MAPQGKGGQELKKNKSPNMIIEANSQTPKIFLLCCFAVIRVQK
jgi:hypothetical protein